MSTHISREMLLFPRDVGARAAAVALLEDAHAGAKALAAADDPDGLHDFRVAVRRLRSWLRAFEPELADGVSKKQRRRLRDIARTTNAGRDTEVQLDWFRDAAKARGAQRRRGAKWMIVRAKDANGNGVSDKLAGQFQDTRDDLEARLSICAVNVRELVRMPSLATAIAERLPMHSAALERALARVETVDDEEDAHQARISTKRLRYLVEPGASLIRSGAPLLGSLKHLQDELGTLHDAHIIAREIRRARRDAPANTRAGLDALEAHVTDVAATAFATVQRNWLRGRYARVDRTVSRFASRLARL